MFLNTSWSQFTTELLTPELEELFRSYNASNRKQGDPMVVAKFTFPWSDLKWYATQFENDSFYGFVTGFLSPKWEDFTLQSLKEMEYSAGEPVLRDLDFSPAPFSSAVAENEKHLPGNSIVMRETQEEVAYVLAEPEAIYLSETSKEEALDFTSVYENLKKQYKGDAWTNPEFLNDLQTLWGFRTNKHGVITEAVEEIQLIEKNALEIKVYLAESEKGYCKYGLSIRTNDSGVSYSPSIFKPVGFFSKEIAMTEAKSEILNWLEKEVKTSSGTKLAQLSRALKEISAVDYSQLDLF